MTLLLNEIGKEHYLPSVFFVVYEVKNILSCHLVPLFLFKRCLHSTASLLQVWNISLCLIYRNFVTC
jgi:hypothetical protein